MSDWNYYLVFDLANKQVERDLAPRDCVILRRIEIGHEDYGVDGDVDQPLIIPKGIETYGSKPDSEELAEAVKAVTESIEALKVARKIAMPPGRGMRRVVDVLFFFQPKAGERAFDDLIATYAFEMIEAERRGDRRSMRRLRCQYWGGFLWTVANEFVFGVVGKIVKAIKGG